MHVVLQLFWQRTFAILILFSTFINYMLSMYCQVKNALVCTYKKYSLYVLQTKRNLAFISLVL